MAIQERFRECALGSLGVGAGGPLPDQSRPSSEGDPARAQIKAWSGPASAHKGETFQ